MVSHCALLVGTLHAELGHKAVWLCRDWEGLTICVSLDETRVRDWLREASSKEKKGKMSRERGREGGSVSKVRLVCLTLCGDCLSSAALLRVPLASVPVGSELEVSSRSCLVRLRVVRLDVVLVDTCPWASTLSSLCVVNLPSSGSCRNG